MKKLMLTMLVVAVSAGTTLAAEKAKVSLPVTKVVLFSSGVGYFEHYGSVEGDATATLMFKTDQINDVLKSMVLIDEDGGTVRSVNYASRDPLTRALKSFAVDISGDPDLAQLLKQLRGAQVIIEAPEKITGKILGVEFRKKELIVGGTTTIITEAVLNLVTPGGIKSIGMNAVANLTLTDEKLAGELNKALALVIESHDTQRKGVDIRFTGKGKRRVRIGYIAETPVWKTSYRLVLDEKKNTLQGWAIVENTSDVDWSKVGLSLVSGRPISFIQDLYTPLYLPRPIVRPELYASLKPRRYDEGIAGKDKEVRDRPELLERKKSKSQRFEAESADRAMALPRAPGAAYADGRANRKLDLAKGVQSIASAGKVGELFHFAVRDPVNLARRRSAMLPIVNSPVKAEKVSIYNRRVLAKHPLNGVQLINDTDMKLLGGPITVFDGGMYAGDAQIGNLAAGDKRLLSYAIDLNMTVDPSNSSTTRLVSGKIVNGTLYLRRLSSYVQKYVLKNKAEEKRAVIVEHPYNSARKLVSPEKYEEKTPALYRFRVAVAAGKTETLEVKEEQVHHSTVGILNTSASSLLYYSRSGEISKKVREALAKAVLLKNELVTLQRKLGELVNRKNVIERGQDRLRRNLNTVGKTSTLGRRYLGKLSKQEDEIEKLDAQISELRVQVERKRKELEDYLRKLNVD